MLNNEGQAQAPLQAIPPQSSSATINGSYLDVHGAEGDILAVYNVGAVTGSITPAFADATDSGGTGSAAITPNEAVAAISANTVKTYTFRANSVRSFMRCTATIVTGPVLVGVTLHRRPKNF